MKRCLPLVLLCGCINLPGRDYVVDHKSAIIYWLDAARVALAGVEPEAARAIEALQDLVTAIQPTGYDRIALADGAAKVASLLSAAADRNKNPEILRSAAEFLRIFASRIRAGG